MTARADGRHLILLLDLATQHPIELDLVVRMLPPGSSYQVHRLTDHGALQSPTGTPDDWTSVRTAIADFAADADKQRPGDPGRTWIAGRAGLPAFFDLGYRLTARSPVTLIHQRKSGEIDVLRLDQPGAAPTPLPSPAYFRRSPMPPEPVLARGRLGLVITSRAAVPRAQIEATLRARGIEPVAIVEAQAPGILDESVLPSALCELDQLIQDMQDSYPESRSLAVFVARPATLAYLAGRALESNIFSDIQFHEHRDERFQLAFETRPRQKLLVLAANPSRMTQLDLRDEVQQIQRELERSGRGDRFEILPVWAAQRTDLLRELRRYRPTLLHFACHGGTEGLYLEGEDGSPRALSADVLREVIDAVGIRIQLIVLNACNSIDLAASLSRHVPAAVGMTGAIHDVAARSFAAGFYGALGDGEPLSAAFHQGRVAIRLGDAAGAMLNPRDVNAPQGAATAVPEHERPQLSVRSDIESDQLFLVPRLRR